MLFSSVQSLENTLQVTDIDASENVKKGCWLNQEIKRLQAQSSSYASHHYRGSDAKDIH